jgi:hypothetical protein
MATRALARVLGNEFNFPRRRVHLIDGKAMCACEMSCGGAQILPFRIRATKISHYFNESIQYSCIGWFWVTSQAGNKQYCRCFLPSGKKKTEMDLTFRDIEGLKCDVFSWPAANSEIKHPL